MNVPLSANKLVHAELYELLQAVCTELDITETQYNQAKSAYEALSDWLARCDLPMFKSVSIYPHGSAGLGTINRPIVGEEFDIDLICFFPHISAHEQPSVVKKLVGDRLRAHETYKNMLVEKKRCWRLNYAGMFHADVAPTIRNPACRAGGELVPDKLVRDWKPTNPRGYRKLFDERAKLVPSGDLFKIRAMDEFGGTVEAFPNYGSKRGLLRQTIQVLKRHRDVVFENIKADIKPISIIVTTLASQAYEYAVSRHTHATSFDVILATIVMMPHFIEKRPVNGKMEYVVANETTAGENFADRWNQEPQRAKAFYEWHQRVLGDFQSLSNLRGTDQIQAALGRMFGVRLVNSVFEKRLAKITEARAASKLHVAPRVGLTTTAPAAAALVRPNTFFGRK